MKRISGLTAIALCMLIIGCAGSVKHQTQVTKGPDLGYALDAKDVVFRFDPAAYTQATRNDNGRWVPMSQVAVNTVTVAGNFNDWSRQAWPMDRMDDGAYELRKSRDYFGPDSKWEFKFVVNGAYWVEPPRGAPNTTRTGYWKENHSSNLVMTVP